VKWPSVLTLLILTVGCEDKIKPSVLSSVPSKDLPQQESWNSQIVLADSGRVKAIIDAGYLRVFETNERTLLSDGVTVIDKDLKIKFQNRKITELYGSSMIGKHCFNAYRGRNKPCEDCKIIDVLFSYLNEPRKFHFV